MKNQRLLLVIFTLAVLGLACGMFGGSNTSNTPTTNAGVSPPEPSQTAPLAAVENSEQAGEPAELPPMTLDEVYLAGVEAGNWTEAEGLLLFMQYLAGEVSANKLPGVSEVLDSGGTEMVQRARAYYSQPDNDPAVTAELDYLFRKLFPPQDVLDAISEPYTAFVPESGKLASSRPQPAQQDIGAGTCQELYDNGYNPNDLGVTCYLYLEKMADDLRVRVYFPVEWLGNEDVEKLTLVETTANALKTAMEYYNVIPNLTTPNINMVFSLQLEPELPESNGYVDRPAVDADACPATLSPNGYQHYDGDQYNQLVAQLAFYCVGFETFNYINSETDGWWFQGASEYFSNEVYPYANLEYRKLPYFDRRSANIPIDQMSHESFVFFQWLGNQIGEDGVVNIMHEVSDAGGDINALALMDADYFEGHFNEFVVEFLSTGILDTNGQDRIKSTSPPRVSGTKSVTNEGDLNLAVAPWVAQRYFVDYKQEMRFLQDQTNGDFAFSSVEYPNYQDISAWSALPAEVRSSCTEDVRYLFVPTTTYNNEPYQFNITTAETASCDPCLLGVWAVDNDSFEEYALALFEAEGVDPVEGVSQFGEFTFDISGMYYIGFGENGQMAAWRDNYTITISAGGFVIDTIISSNGLGTYSADGETLTIHNLYDYVTGTKIVMDGTEIAPPPTFDGPDYSMFKQTYEPQQRDEITTTSGAQPYVCQDDSLSVEMDPLGELRFYRVEEIIPTPVSTPQN